MSEVKCSTCKGVGRLEFEQGQRRVPCVTCSGSGVDWRKTCEGVQQEAEVLRYDLQVAHSVINTHKPELDAQRLRADTAEAELRIWKEKACEAAERHVAAEQRIAELKSVLERMLEDDDMPVHWFAQRIDAALNPNPEAESHE